MNRAISYKLDCSEHRDDGYDNLEEGIKQILHLVAVARELTFSKRNPTLCKSHIYADKPNPSIRLHHHQHHLQENQHS